MREERLAQHVWEPACGMGHLVQPLLKAGYTVRASDLVDRPQIGGGYFPEVLDFLGLENIEPWKGDILTNPPYRYATEFVYRALQLVQDGAKVCMFLKLTFLEGRERRQLFCTCPPRTVYVFSRRVLCAKNGDFTSYESSAVAYAWFVWEKGYHGNTIVRWIN